MKKITFKVLPDIHLPFSISRDNTAISYRVALLENVILLPGKTRLVKACWKPLLSGCTFMLNVTYYAITNALVDSNTPGYIKIINPSNLFLKMRKQDRITVITNSYSSRIFYLSFASAITALVISVITMPTVPNPLTAPNLPD